MSNPTVDQTLMTSMTGLPITAGMVRSNFRIQPYILMVCLTDCLLFLERLQRLRPPTNFFNL